MAVFKTQKMSNRLVAVVGVLLALVFSLTAISTLVYAQTAQPKPDSVNRCPTGLPRLNFDAVIMQGEKTQKVWLLHSDMIHPGKTCVVINGRDNAAPDGWEPMKGVHQFILTVSINGSIQKLLGDAKAGKRMYVINIPADHMGISWVCNHSGHFIHSGGSADGEGKVMHNGVKMLP